MISCHSVHVPLKHDMVKTKSPPPNVTVKMSADTNFVSLIQKYHKRTEKYEQLTTVQWNQNSGAFLSKESFPSSTVNI